MAEVTFRYESLPIHVPFHTSGAYERCLFGAFGSGKTYGLCAEAIAWALEHPGIRGLITRKTVPELRDTTETVFFEILPNEIYKAGEEKRAGGHVERFIFPNGSEILFRSIDNWEKHKSLNVGFIAWDEADEFDEETYLGMSSRVRQKEPTPLGRQRGATTIARRGMWCAANPAGHNWLYYRFVDPSKRTDKGEWFRSTSFDNPYLPPEYISSLLDYPEPWVRRYVLCQFDDFAGQIYEDWGWDSHVIKPIDPYPDGSTFWMGMDPGTRSPTAGLWVWVDKDNGRLVGVKEYQENYTAATEHVKNWRAIESKLKGPITWRTADPSVNTHERETNNVLADVYRRMGYSFHNGPRQHKDRIPPLANLIHTGRFVITEECPQTYEAIKNYKWEDVTPTQRSKGVDPPEKPLKKDDHLVDCAQYLAARWVRPTPVQDMNKGETFSEKINRLGRAKRIAQRNPRSADPGVGIV